MQEEGGPGVSRTVDHAYFFLQISTIRLLLKFNLLDLDIIDAESSTSVHQCQIEMQRQGSGRAEKSRFLTQANALKNVPIFWEAGRDLMVSV